ncbi:MAG: DNA-3-methyladenine glycosylase I [Pyrinomonadaceae bacterium]
MSSFGRCTWPTNELAVRYHDEEWGVPLHDDIRLFEFIVLEGAQAGLSWDTILAKRQNYRAAFDGFDPTTVAAYDEVKIADLMANSGIIRNRLKIASAIANANAFINVQNEFGSFNEYIWTFVNGRPLVNRWNNVKDVPARTYMSDMISKDLNKRGFNFVGSTIIYAFMQATGMVNDHLTTCFRFRDLDRHYRISPGARDSVNCS